MKALACLALSRPTNGKHARSTAIHNRSHDLTLLALPQRHRLQAGWETGILHNGLGRRVLSAQDSRRAEASHPHTQPRSALGLGQRAPVAGLHARAACRVPVIPVPVRVVVVPVLALAGHAHARHPGVHQPGAQHTPCGSARALSPNLGVPLLCKLAPCRSVLVDAMKTCSALTYCLSLPHTAQIGLHGLHWLKLSPGASAPLPKWECR